MLSIPIYEELSSQQVNVCEGLLQEGTAVWWRWWLFCSGPHILQQQPIISLMLAWVLYKLCQSLVGIQFLHKELMGNKSAKIN